MSWSSPEECWKEAACFLITDVRMRDRDESERAKHLQRGQKRRRDLVSIVIWLAWPGHIIRQTVGTRGEEN